MIEMRLEGAELMKRRLDRLKLDKRTEGRLLRRMGNRVRRESRKRITRQTEVSGGRFEPRADRSNRARMLLGFRQHLKVRVIGGEVVVFIPGAIGKAAREHQEGFTEVVRAKALAQRQRQRNRGRRATEPGNMATRQQARRLKELGFRKPQRWLMETFTRAEAGYIIRKEEGRAAQQTWTVTVPARPFLGASDTDRAEMRQMVSDALNSR